MARADIKRDVIRNADLVAKILERHDCEIRRVKGGIKIAEISKRVVKTTTGQEEG